MRVRHDGYGLSAVVRVRLLRICSFSILRESDVGEDDGQPFFNHCLFAVGSQVKAIKVIMGGVFNRTRYSMPKTVVYEASDGCVFGDCHEILAMAFGFLVVE